jgi:hypothetical protein
VPILPEIACCGCGRQIISEKYTVTKSGGAPGATGYESCLRRCHGCGFGFSNANTGDSGALTIVYTDPFWDVPGFIEDGYQKVLAKALHELQDCERLACERSQHLVELGPRGPLYLLRILMTLELFRFFKFSFAINAECCVRQCFETGNWNRFPTVRAESFCGFHRAHLSAAASSELFLARYAHKFLFGILLSRDDTRRFPYTLSSPTVTFARSNCARCTATSSSRARQLTALRFAGRTWLTWCLAARRIPAHH